MQSVTKLSVKFDRMMSGAKKGQRFAPTLRLSWLPDQGSNLGPADYSASALDYLITLSLTC